MKHSKAKLGFDALEPKVPGILFGVIRALYPSTLCPRRQQSRPDVRVFLIERGGAS
jgi:hypothetical protein